MAELHVLVGVAGSGKSTYAVNLVKQYCNAKIFSSDALRLELYGDENDQTHNREVFEELHKRILEYIKNDGVAICDACNLTYKSRMALLKKIPEGVQKICHILPVTYELAVKRQDLRERKVPPEVIFKQICSFQTPYWHEGWSVIKIKTTPEDRIQLYDIIQKHMGTSHDNPHHKYSIGKHSLESYLYAVSKNFPLEVIEASLFHDIGKPFVKSFVNTKGEITSVAHYYNHQNYGSYLALLSNGLDFHSPLLVISFLICYHMEEFIRKDKVYKFYNLIGEKEALQLKQLHECDLSGH